MTSRRKILLLVAALAVPVASTIALWPRPRGYTYQGKTVEQWFKQGVVHVVVDPSTGLVDTDDGLRQAFRKMGTNAVPFLASRITQDLEPTFFDRLADRLPKRFQPQRKEAEAWLAITLLVYAHPPENMLRELLKPALLGTNQMQGSFANLAFDELHWASKDPPAPPVAPIDLAPLPPPPPPKNP